MNIQYGNRTGKWFKPYGIQELVELAEIVAERSRVCDFRIWYDAEQDFYHCAFERNGHPVDVRFYICLSVKIDGKDGWVGCPRSQVHEFVDRMLRQTGGYDSP